MGEIEMTVSIIFDKKGDFAALQDAKSALQSAGFSIGSIQRGYPTAIMFGDYSVSKWSSLNREERLATHAQLTGDNRHGPLTLTILPAAPDQAIAAIQQMVAA